MHLHAVDELFVEYSESAKVIGRSDELLQSIRNDKTMLGKPAQVRNDDEVYRVKLAYIYRRLQFRIHYAEDDASHAELMYHSSSELLEDLRILDRSLRSHKGDLQAEGLVEGPYPQRRDVRFSSCHARYSSAPHRSYGDRFGISGATLGGYSSFTNEQREHWLTEEIMKHVVPSFDESKLSPMSAETLAVFPENKESADRDRSPCGPVICYQHDGICGRHAGGALPDEVHGTLLDRSAAYCELP